MNDYKLFVGTICPYCAKVENFVEEENINIDIVNIEEDREAMRKLIEEDKILYSLENHGFARDLNWQFIDYGEDFAKLSLDGIGLYEGIKFIIDYKLSHTNLFAKLLIENNSNKQVLLAPGFHPYFYAEHKAIFINNKKIDKNQLPNSIIDNSFKESFVTNGNKIFIEGLKNINEFVFWSDFKGDYLCVEPTYKSIAFKDDNGGAYRLKPGKKFEQSINIKVTL